MNSRDEQPDQPRDPGEQLLWNVPNTLCAIRLVGSLILVPVALFGRPMVFLGVFLVVAGTDWIDGKLAIWLKQRTTFGARFDSVADAAMYAALLLGCVWLKGDVLLAEAAWIGAALMCYVLSCLSALYKFRRLPSYHTYSAKISWLMTVLAAVALLSGWAVWPLRVAMLAVSLANLEALLITLLSNRWRTDIPTLWHALASR